MPTLAQGQASSCANPVLDIYTVVDGLVTDVDVLEFQIFELVNDPDNPSQVFPATPGDRQTVDVSNECPTGGKVDLGRYVAKWDVPTGEPVGLHEIRWFYKKSAGDNEKGLIKRFNVTSQTVEASVDGYCTVQDLRDEGVPSSGVNAVSDAQIEKRIEHASRLIERYTGRIFEPKPMKIRVDGSGGRDLLLEHPVISVSQIKMISEEFSSASDLRVDLDDVRIYNRHLQGLTNPDDRDNPKISFVTFDRDIDRFSTGLHRLSVFHPDRWPDGTKNVEIVGIFGYTDPDGTLTGKTPDLIKRACMLMALKDLNKLYGDSDERFDQRNQYRLTKLKTDDQSIEWADPSKFGRAGFGKFTGDPEIDQILLSYMRPPGMGAA